MNVQEIDALIQEKNPPCISIIIPTERAVKKENYEVLKKSIQRAKESLMRKAYAEEMKTSIALKIDAALKTLPSTLLEGLGIYISSKQTRTILFPFPVKQKITVDETFELRDLFYLRQYLTPYYVLSFSKNTLQFYSASMDELEEIKDGNFPLLHDGQYKYPQHYSNPFNGNTLKVYGKGNAANSTDEIKVVLKEADAYLTPYLSEKVKLVLAGPQKAMGTFLTLTQFSKNVIGKVSGSFTRKSTSALGKSAWSALIRHKKGEDELLVQELMQDKSHVAVGLKRHGKRHLKGKLIYWWWKKIFISRLTKNLIIMRFRCSPLENHTKS